MGAYLSEPVRDKETEAGQDARLAFGCASMQGWRTSMEDAHTAILGLGGDPQAAIFGVYDGHGGREVAHFCRRHVAEHFSGTKAFKRGDIGEGLIETFLAMDGLILQPEGRRELLQYAHEGRAKSSNAEVAMHANVRAALASNRALCTEDEDDVEADDSLPQAGTTAVVGVVSGNVLTVANVGDSRAVLCRKGEAVEMSLDHKPTLESERQRIQNAGGFVAEGRVNGSLALSRAIGDFEFKTSTQLDAKDQVISAYPDIKTEQLREGDEFLIIACDGIWDVLSSQECVDLVRDGLQRGDSLTAICNGLCDTCIASDTKGTGLGCDNMTVLVVVFKELAGSIGASVTCQ